MNEGLTFLFSRLTWPSGMVRERACVVIADLLINSQWTEIVQKHLIRWMKAQTLESIVAIGLLVFLRAKIQDSGFVIPPAEELSSACHRSSVLSWMLMNELMPNNVPSLNWATLNSGSAPENFQTDPFFTKYSRTFLPPIYTDSAKQIEARSRVPFVRQWAFEWHRILQNIGKQPSTDPLYFWGNEHSDHYVAIDFELSEVYRSAFLRALAWAVMVGALSVTDAEYFALKTCPIDLGLWRLKSTSQPIWWPKADEREGRPNTIPAEIWKQVEALWNRQQAKGDKWIVAEASGRVFETTTIYDLEIFGIFQACQGPSAPNLDELINWYKWRNYAQHDACSLCFEGIVERTSPDTLAQNFGDWSVLPVACRILPYTIPRWQFWRIYRGIWLPAPFLSCNPLTFRCSDDALIADDGEKIIGKWTDWTKGLREKITANLSPATGQHLLVQRENIETFAEESNLVFCWVCRLTGYHRKYDYEPYEQFVEYRQFGSLGE